MMDGDAVRQAIADQLQALSLPELVDVLQRVLPAHAEQRRNGLARKLVLAEAFVYDDTIPRTAEDPPVTVEVVAWPDRAYYEGGFGPEPDLLEQGTCARCSVEVTSTAKRALCPICGELCDLT